MKSTDNSNTKNKFPNTHNSNYNNNNHQLQQQQHQMPLQRQVQQHHQQQHQLIRQPQKQLQQPQQLQLSQKQLQRQQQQQQQHPFNYKADNNKVTRKTSNLGNPRDIFNNLSKVFKPSNINERTTKEKRGNRERITNGLYTVERVNEICSIQTYY